VILESFELLCCRRHDCAPLVFAAFASQDAARRVFSHDLHLLPM
jgi:hypothetical protein